MRIIHLSDIHLKNINEEDNVFSKLFEDLYEFNRISNIDLIVITGDLVDKGGSSFDSLEVAFEIFEKKFINEIVDKIKIDKEKIIFCPGNHDINAKAIDEFNEEGLKNKLNNKNIVDKFIKDRSNKIDFSIERLREFKEFEKRYHKNSKGNITNFESNYIFEIDGYKVGITALNSSWRCSVTDKDLILGEKQIENSKKIIEDCDIKIALMHHSFEFFKEFEKISVKNKIFDTYDYLFLGHVHTNDSFFQIGLIGNLFTSIAQSISINNISEKDVLYSLGYSIIDLNFEKLNVKVTGRRYSNISNRYVANVDIFGENGYKEYPMLLEKDKQEKRNIRALLKKIEDIHLEDCNKHLLSYKTDSKAPKTINEIFTTPTILGEKSEDENIKQQKYSLKNICDFNEKIIIFGTKESGKTILLDKLAIEFMNNFDKYEKLPVRIDFDNMNSNNISTEIKRYLGVRESEKDKLLMNGNIVLLLDNVTFSDRNKNKIKFLKNFISNNSKIKIIIASENRIEGEAPINFAKDEFFKQFTNLYIGIWKSKEINSIIANWYSNNDINECNVTVKEIVKIFGNIKMSITPLNVSMFLWIIEHQQNYKLINKGKLMECFFEYLLQKLEGEDSYSDTFDYTNKIRLLANIAYKMYMNEGNKYKIEYIELLEFTKQYLRNRKFIIDYEEIIHYFINKGILIEQTINEERYIVYRFECFYRFFITQYILNNREFRNFAFNEENFLSFQDEIEYLTGINRDEVDLLKILTARMENQFKKLEEIIYNNNRDFDSYFVMNNKSKINIESRNIDEIKENKKRLNIDKIEENIEDKKILTIKNEVAVGEVKENIPEYAIDVLFDLWNLVAKVLKNTEETNDVNLKNDIYVKVLKTSILYFILYKVIIDDFIKNRLESNPEDINFQIMSDMDITSRIIPLINSQTVNKVLSTTKLELVVKEEIEKGLNGNKKSELEITISLLLLHQINSSKALEYISKFIKQIKHKYIRELIKIDLIHGYYMSNNKVLEKKYIEIIYSLQVDTQKEKQAMNMFGKSKVIEKLKSAKKEFQEDLETCI